MRARADLYIYRPNIVCDLRALCVVSVSQRERQLRERERECRAYSQHPLLRPRSQRHCCDDGLRGRSRFSMPCLGALRSGDVSDFIRVIFFICYCNKGFYVGFFRHAGMVAAGHRLTHGPRNILLSSSLSPPSLTNSPRHVRAVQVVISKYTVSHLAMSVCHVPTHIYKPFHIADHFTLWLVWCVRV